MSRSHKPRETVFAVVRYDSDARDLQVRVTIKEIVRSQELAEAEVERLNRLNADKGCVYFWQSTRLFSEGLSAGTSAVA